MANTEAIVAAGPADFILAVIDVSNPASPKAAPVNPGFGGGLVVDADGARAAVGDLNGGQVALYDLTNPASPVKLGSIITTLFGIGAISVDGNRVLAGEMGGTRAILVDFSNPGAPTIASTVNTSLSSISSIALSGPKAVASGPNDFALAILDFSNPASPSAGAFDPGLNSVLTVDFAGTLAAVGAQNSREVALVDVTGPSALGTVTTALGGIDSINITGSLVAAGSNNDSDVFLIDFTNAQNPGVRSLDPGVRLGASVFRTANRLAAGAVAGSTVALFDVSGSAATSLAVVSSGLSAIASIAITDFVGPPPPPPPPTNPHLVLSATSLGFGSIAVCLSGTQTLIEASVPAFTQYASFRSTGGLHVQDEQCSTEALRKVRNSPPQEHQVPAAGGAARLPAGQAGRGIPGRPACGSPL